jgi:hypothetical protein
MSFNLVSASQLDITESLSGGAFGSGLSSTTVSDLSPTATTFDYLLFRSATASAIDVKFQNLTVSQTSAVPEPSTYAALAGVAVLGLAFWRRRFA